ncbi:MAG: hypothetical protein M1828_007278 [Chrysothrix sp. TS-e1954]|nr:MAG: hypothetical protein M1828_007278 [Chrysothrix sp. TS-e1954]
MAVQDHGPAVLVVTTVMVVLATVFVTLRLLSRFAIVQRGATVDDYVIVLAWVISVGLSFAICYATRFGLGKHERDIPDRQRDKLDELNYTFMVLYNPALMATKTSIMLFYLTLAKTGQRLFKWLTIGNILLTDLVGFALLMLNILQCRPVSAAYQDLPTSQNVHCIDFVTLYLSSAPLNIITDLIILLLPVPILKNMTLPRKQKIILYITFGFGIFVAVVDVVRMSYLEQAQVTRAKNADRESMTQSGDERETDFSWYASLSFMWSAIEVNVGIMCACVPALKPLVLRFMPTLVRDAVSSRVGKGGYRHNTLNSIEMADARRVPPMRSEDSEEQSDGTDNPGQRDGPNMSMADFLTTPDTAEFPRAPGRRDTAITNHTTGTARDPAFYDFVNMSKSKGIVYMTNRESVSPLAKVTVLFFLWGFAYGLLNTLNAQVQLIAGLSIGQTVANHGMYFVGYLVAPLSYGRLLLRNWGFKACYIVGLLVYGTGTLVFWPAAVLLSFPAFMISNFIVGMGLSTLEVAANPFIALCGPPQYAEMRLNLSQGFQAIGTVVSPLLAKKALFNTVLDAPSLIDVQWTYLGISIFTFILAVIYFMIDLPEASDEELDDAAQQTHPVSLPTLKSSHTLALTLAIAAFAQFCYVAGQESVALFVSAYITYVQPSADAVNYEAIGHTLFALSRFLSAALGFVLKPRYQLVLWTAGTIIFSALAMVSAFSGLKAGSMVMCVYFFEGPIFSLLYAIPLRGLGRRAKDAAALITASTSGGALGPGLYYLAAQSRGDSGQQYAYCTVIATSAATALFAVYLNLWPSAREQVDPIMPGKGDGDGDGDGGGGARRWEGSRLRRPTFVMPNRKSWGVLQLRRRRGSDGGSWRASSGGTEASAEGADVGDGEAGKGFKRVDWADTGTSDQNSREKAEA